MHRVHLWGLCSFLFKRCSCAVPSTFKGLNIKYHPAKSWWGSTLDFIPPLALSWGQEFRHWTTSPGWELLTSGCSAALCSGTCPVPARLCSGHSSTGFLLLYPLDSASQPHLQLLTHLMGAASYSLWLQLSPYNAKPLFSPPPIPISTSSAPTSSLNFHRSLCYGDLSW